MEQENMIRLEAKTLVNTIWLQMLTDMVIVMKAKYENLDEEKIRDTITKALQITVQNHIIKIQSESSNDALIDEIQGYLESL